MAIQQIFKPIKKGDTFYGAVDGGIGGLVIRLSDSETNIGYDNLRVSLRFRDTNNNIALELTTDVVDEVGQGITNIGDGYYRIEKFKVNLSPRSYRFDFTITFPNGDNFSSETGEFIVNPEI